MIRPVLAVFEKEWRQAFAAPSIWLEIALLAATSMALAFFAGKFFDAGRADLAPYFRFLPLSFLLAIPVIGARFWVDEFTKGTIDLYWSGPRSVWILSVGKWLALTAMIIVGLLFVLPLWIQISWLGDPDHRALITAMLGAILMAGAVAAIALSASASAANTGVATLLGILLIALLTLPVLGPTIPALPPQFAEAIAGFSIPAHFSGFANGTINLASVFYFLSLMATGLFLSTQMIQIRTCGFDFASGSRIGLAVLIFAVSNLMAPSTIRLDLTSDKLFSVSPAAKQLASQLQTPKFWTFYYSAPLGASYPDIRQFAVQVRETLFNLQRASNGKLLVSERIPMPDTDLEDAAIAAGIKPLITDTGQPLYFGLADQFGALIHQFDLNRASLLEFDLLQQLVVSNKSKAALRLSDSTDMAAKDWYITGQKPSAIFEQLTADYSLLEAKNNQRSDLWMLVHAQRPNAEKLRKRLYDEHPLRLVVLVDPYRESAARPALSGLPRLGAKSLSTLPKPLQDLGLEMIQRSVVIDPALAANAQIKTNGKKRLSKYPAWLQLGPENIAIAGPMQNAIRRTMVMASAGALRGEPVDGWRFRPLLLTSEQAMLVPAHLLANGASADALHAAGHSPGQQVLAGLLSHQQLDKQILVIADTDFINDQFYGQHDPVFGWQELADNGRFLHTIIDIFVRAPKLMDLPIKTRTNRPLSRIETLRATASAKQIKEQVRLSKLQTHLNQQLLNSANPAAIHAQILQAQQQYRQIRKEFHGKITLIENSLLLSNVFLFPLGFALFGLFRTGRTRRR